LGTWAIYACMAANKALLKNVSQLSSPLLDVDDKNEEIEAWTESRLLQTLGARTSLAINLAQGVGNINPMFQVSMPDTPTYP